MQSLILPGVALASAALGFFGGFFLRRLGRGAAADVEPARFVGEHLPVGVLLFSSEGRIAFANQPACDLLFAGEPPAGRNFLHLLDDAPAPVCRALTGSGDALFSLSFDGEQQTFQLLRRELDFRGAQHVLLLINPLTREVARREVDVLKKVIAVINHELNNSLASMSSLLSSGRYIIDHPEKIANLVRVFDGLEGRTEHLQRFLSEYAQLSRLPEPRPTEVQWAPLLQRLSQLYPEAQVGQPPSRPGWFDEVQVEQALINLLKNATEAGGSPRQVRLVMRRSGGWLELGVLDRGTGFSQEALQQGLLPFYSTKEKGSGIGLALSREVADGHGGSLRIKQREGGGSAVYLVLPSDPKTAQAPRQNVALTLTRT